MRHFTDCLQIRFELRKVSLVSARSQHLVSPPDSGHCPVLHNNTLRVTASESSWRPIVAPRGQASPVSASLLLVETPVTWPEYWLPIGRDASRWRPMLWGNAGLGWVAGVCLDCWVSWPGLCFTSEELSAVTCVQTQGPIIPIIPAIILGAIIQRNTLYYKGSRQWKHPVQQLLDQVIFTVGCCSSYSPLPLIS